MNAFEMTIRQGILVEKVNLVRATMMEAYEIKDILTETGFSFSKIVVDLSSCDYIDSTFMGALVYSYRKISERNGTIVLVVSEKFLSSSFIFTEISTIFRTFKSVNEAVENLKEKVSEFYFDEETEQLNDCDKFD